MSMITHKFPPRVEPRLSTFNALAAQYQDEAYTLAFYLSGSDTQALQVVQLALADLYRRAPRRADDFRLEVLRRVIAVCHGQRPAEGRALSKDALCTRLLTLTEHERWAAVLVDVLGLGYEEAARVLGCFTRQINHWLAQARLGLSPQPALAA